MSEMVERVARAIEGTYEQYADPTPAQRARAAIEAMREPTEAMVAAGDEKCGIFKHADSTWRAMIDEALK